MYERRAGLALGRDPKFLGLPFASEWIRQQGHSMKTAVNAVAGTVGTKHHFQEACDLPLVKLGKQNVHRLNPLASSCGSDRNVSE